MIKQPNDQRPKRSAIPAQVGKPSMDDARAAPMQRPFALPTPPEDVPGAEYKAPSNGLPGQGYAEGGDVEGDNASPAVGPNTDSATTGLAQLLAHVNSVLMTGYRKAGIVQGDDQTQAQPQQAAQTGAIPTDSDGDQDGDTGSYAAGGSVDEDPDDTAQPAQAIPTEDQPLDQSAATPQQAQAPQQAQQAPPQILGLLQRRDALPPQQADQMLRSAQGQGSVGLMRALAGAPPEQQWPLLQSIQQRFDHMTAIAHKSINDGHDDAAARQISDAYDYLMDGNKLVVRPSGQGQFTASVTSADASSQQAPTQRFEEGGNVEPDDPTGDNPLAGNAPGGTPLSKADLEHFIAGSVGMWDKIRAMGNGAKDLLSKYTPDIDSDIPRQAREAGAGIKENLERRRDTLLNPRLSEGDVAAGAALGPYGLAVKRVGEATFSPKPTTEPAGAWTEPNMGQIPTEGQDKTNLGRSGADVPVGPDQHSMGEPAADWTAPKIGDQRTPLQKQHSRPGGLLDPDTFDQKQMRQAFAMAGENTRQGGQPIDTKRVMQAYEQLNARREPLQNKTDVADIQADAKQRIADQADATRMRGQDMTNQRAQMRADQKLAELGLNREKFEELKSSAQQKLAAANNRAAMQSYEKLVSNMNSNLITADADGKEKFEASYKEFQRLIKNLGVSVPTGQSNAPTSVAAPASPDPRDIEAAKNDPRAAAAFKKKYPGVDPNTL